MLYTLRMKFFTYKLVFISLVAVVFVSGTIYARPAWFGLSVKTNNIASPLWITDVADPHKLVGISNNVFVGEVVAEKGTYIHELGIPETEFQVRVLENIKGKLPEMVTLNQVGGYDSRSNSLILVENDALLQLGAKYLFATAVDTKNKTHRIISKFGDIPVVTEKDQLQIVSKFKEAYHNEIPFMFQGKNLGTPFVDQASQ